MTSEIIRSTKNGWLLPLSIAVLSCIAPTAQPFPSDFVSPFSWCESTHKPQPFYGPIPTIPQLPEQYSLKVEANILAKDWTTELEEHFDRPNQRASLATTFNGTTTRTIFNFKAGEKYDIYPNGTRGTRPGQIDFFGYFTRDKSDNNKPAMSTVSEMLRMGTGFNLSYVGQTAVRGIKVNHWTSCQQWQAFGAQFQLDYYFTHPDYLPATGETRQEMPIRIVLNGTAGNINMNNMPMKGSHRFLNFYDFTSIRIGMPRDSTVFEIPPGVVCHGRSDHKAMPDLPDVFEMSMEMTMTDLPIPSPQQKLLYDYQHGLVETRREMMVPKGFGTMSPRTLALSEMNFDDYVEMNAHIVEDYNTGLKYLVNQQNLKCSVERLTSNQGGTPVMAHGEALLKLARGQKFGSSDFTYQGLTTFRNLKVEVWGSEVNGITQQVFFLAHPSVYHSMIKPDDNHDDMPKFNNGGEWPPAGWSGGSQQNPGSPPPQQPSASQTNSGPYYSPPASPNADSSSRPPRPRPSGQTNMPGNTQRPGTGGSSRGTEKPERPNSTHRNLYGNTQKPNTGGTRQTSGPTGNPRHSSMPEDGYPQGQAEDDGKPKSNGEMLSDLRQSVTGVEPKMFMSPKVMGLLFRNKTAVGLRNMTQLFRQLMSDNILKWWTMAQNVLNNEEGSIADSADMGDQLSWGMNMEKQMGNHYGEAVINVYNFKATHSVVDHFQVSSCFNVDQTSDVMLMVKTPFAENVQNNMEAFINSIRRALAEAIGVSLLAISKLSAVPLKSKAMAVNATAVTFTLLGHAPIQGTGLRTLSIQNSKSKLIAAIANGVSFKVGYLGSTKSFIVDKTSYVLDYPSKAQEVMANTQNVLDDSQQVEKDDDSDSGKFSSGAVAGIALVTLVLGGAITLLVVFIVHRRRHLEYPIIPYKKECDANDA